MTTILDLQSALASMNVPIPIRPASSQTTSAAEAEYLNLLLAFLSTPQFGSFPVSAWEDGSPYKALLQGEAYCLADMAATLFNVVSGGIIDLATGIWLDFWGQGQYSESRNPAVQEVSYLWCTTTTSPVNLTAGELIVGTSTNQQYTPVSFDGYDQFGHPTYIQAAVNIPISTTNAKILVQAISNTVGSSGNTFEGAIQFVVSPNVPGLTVTNIDPTNTHAWEIVKGEDAELDNAYRIRLKARWPSLALLRGSTKDAWGFWITQNDPNVRQWNVLENTPTGGQVTIYIDPSTEATSVDQWINGFAGPPAIPAHRPLCTTVFVYGSTTVDVVVTGSIYTSLDLILARSNLQNSLNAYAEIVAMGSKVYYSVSLGLCQAQAGTGYCENIALNGTATDVSLAADAIPQFNIDNVTFISI